MRYSRLGYSMSSSEDRDIELFDWFNRFFGGSRQRAEERDFLVSLIFLEELMK